MSSTRTKDKKRPFISSSKDMATTSKKSRLLYMRAATNKVVERNGKATPVRTAALIDQNLITPLKQSSFRNALAKACQEGISTHASVAEITERSVDRKSVV